MDTNLDAPPTPSWLRTVLIGRHPKRTLVRIVILVAVCVLVRAFILLPIRVVGISMLPTFKDGSIHVVNRLSYLSHEPQRGDVVAIRMLAGGHVMYLKRIVGLPGEAVSFHHGQLYINGQPMEEPYLRLRGTWEHPDEQVGPDHYYVVGDNREMGWPDHEKGRTPRDLIVGKVLL
jgi:signal peptidase I